MIKYFPFTASFDMKMGVSPMKESDLVIEIDTHYQKETALKNSLLNQDHAYYFNKLQGTSAAEWEALEKITADLITYDPVNFSLYKSGKEWRWVNRLLNESQSFTFGIDTSLPLSPLDWIGRQIQEDLVILDNKGVVVAGQLCFPSGWSLNEKLGKQFIEVHAPLPAVTNPMISAANKLIERIPAGKPMSRNNWGFRFGDQLDLSSKHTASYRQKIREGLSEPTPEAIGQKIFLRVEHQTLTRLAYSDCILFTIHTHQSPLEEEVINRERAGVMLSFLKTVPPSLIEYKVMDLFYDKLIEYLTKSIN